MAIVTAEDIEDLIQRMLDERRRDDFELKVIRGETRQEEDWWHVVVRAEPPDIRAYELSHRLLEVEEQLLDENQHKVLLVPGRFDD